MIFKAFIFKIFFTVLFLFFFLSPSKALDFDREIDKQESISQKIVEALSQKNSSEKNLTAANRNDRSGFKVVLISKNKN